MPGGYPDKDRLRTRRRDRHADLALDGLDLVSLRAIGAPARTQPRMRCLLYVFSCSGLLLFQHEELALMANR